MHPGTNPGKLTFLLPSSKHSGMCQVVRLLVHCGQAGPKLVPRTEWRTNRVVSSLPLLSYETRKGASSLMGSLDNLVVTQHGEQGTEAWEAFLKARRLLSLHLCNLWSSVSFVRAYEVVICQLLSSVQSGFYCMKLFLFWEPSTLNPWSYLLQWDSE